MRAGLNTAFRRAVVAFIVVVMGMIWALCGCSQAAEGPKQIRVGFFPNLTHAPALVGLANGTFQEALGQEIEIKKIVFNAGPAVVEALFAGELDLAYLGPNPAINGYVRSKGTALKIVCGSTSGGAVLVVQSDSGIVKPADFAGKKMASPQLGNTQDVALRHYLQQNGLKAKEKGGSVRVIPMQNPDILTSFVKKEIDAAWVPEPWGARLILEGGGRRFLDEKDLWPGGRFVTVNVIASQGFLRQHPDRVKRWLGAHVETLKRIATHPEEVKRVVNAEIERATGKKLKEQILSDAWSRLVFTSDPLPRALFQAAEAAFDLGFLGKERPDLRGIYDLRILNQVLTEKGSPPIEVPE